MKLLQLLSCLLVLQLVNAISVDLDITRDVEEVIKSDNIVITLKHIKPKRRLRGSVETLYAVDFPGSKQKFVLMLDRRSRKVIVETVEDGRHQAQHFTVDTLEEGTLIRSMIFFVNQKQPGAHVTLYVDCVSQGMVATPRSMRDMFSRMTEPKLKVFRERRYTLEIDSQTNLNSVLNRNNCPEQTTESFSNLVQADHPGSDINDIPRRGDIEIIHADCDDLLLKTLNSLIIEIRHLRREVEGQRAEIIRLRGKLEECDLCALFKYNAAALQKETCRNSPRFCFNGVQCHDTPHGPECGDCPRGYIGDGRTCRPGLRCSDRPCYANVECRDTARGAECGPCPPGYVGDGKQCSRRGGCDDRPCAQNVQCVNIDHHPFYRCGPCPAGFTGNGSRCHDLDEVRYRCRRC